MKIPIIFYHRLFHDELDSEKYSVEKKEFIKQLSFLAENGFTSIHLEDFIKLRPDMADGKKRVIITFDDGCSSDYITALPLLVKYGFVATFFTTVKWVDRVRYVSWENLREMASYNMSIQSHGLTHAFLSDLNSVNLYRELKDSKNIIEEKLEMPVNFISLPGGAYSRKVVAMASEVGYKGVCTSRPGFETPGVQCLGSHILHRFIITRQTSLEDFRTIVNCTPQIVLLKQLKYHTSIILRKTLGTKKYYTIWSKFFKKA